MGSSSAESFGVVIAYASVSKKVIFPRCRSAVVVFPRCCSTVVVSTFAVFSEDVVTTFAVFSRVSHDFIVVCVIM